MTDLHIVLFGLIAISLMAAYLVLVERAH